MGICIFLSEQTTINVRCVLSLQDVRLKQAGGGFMILDQKQIVDIKIKDLDWRYKELSSFKSNVLGILASGITIMAGLYSNTSMINDPSVKNLLLGTMGILFASSLLLYRVYYIKRINLYINDTENEINEIAKEHILCWGNTITPNIRLSRDECLLKPYVIMPFSSYIVMQLMIGIDPSNERFWSIFSFALPIYLLIILRMVERRAIKDHIQKKEKQGLPFKKAIVPNNKNALPF